MAVLLRTLLRRAPPPPPSFTFLVSRPPLAPILPPTPSHSFVASTPFLNNLKPEPLSGGVGGGTPNPLHSFFAATGMQFPSLPHFLDIEGQVDVPVGDGGTETIWADSVKRKRKSKMNKHKHQKRQKLQRRKT